MFDLKDIRPKGFKRTRRVNGEKVIEFTAIPMPENESTFDLIVEEASTNALGDKYIIKKLTEQSRGKTYIKNVTAIHKFFVDLINKQQPKVHNGSITFNNYMNLVFEDTGYTFVAVDSFPAREFENLGNDNRLALLQKGLERWGAEFELVGNQVRFYHQIGNDTDFQFRYGHNIKAINVDIDTTNLATRIRGTGDPELGIEAEYTSPNSAIYGIIDAPPVNDERFKSEETLLEEMKRRLIDEPEISITVDFVDLRAAGYPYTVPNEGDRVWLIYEPMNDLLIETRIMEIVEYFKYDEENDEFVVIKTEVTLSNHKKTFAGTMFDNVRKQLRQIVNDDGIIRYSALDEAVKIATEALHSAQTELEFNNGIIAREKTDPNRLVVLNSAGLGISKDGGNTFQEAITADGFVLSVGAVGRLSANHIQIGPETIYSEGDDFDPAYNYVIDGEKARVAPDDYIIGGALYETELTLSDINIGDKFEFSFDIFDFGYTSGGVAITLDPINVTGNIFYDTTIDWGYQTHIITIEQKPSGSPSDKFYIAFIDWQIAELAYMADVSLKKIESGGEKQFDVWIDEKIEVADSLLRNDLRLTSPLPTSITMNQDGITAYTTHDPNAYARLDHRGLYIKGGAIQIDGSFAEPVQQGFNNISPSVKITSRGLETYDGIERTSLLHEDGHSFYRDNYFVGNIGTIKFGSQRGLAFSLGYDADFMTWGHELSHEPGSFVSVFSWEKNVNPFGYRGFIFDDIVRFNYETTFSDRVSFTGMGYIQTYANAIRWGVRGSNYHITQFDNGQVQFHMGSTTATHAFFPDGTKVGGTIEIDGTTYGMSPVDSPQVLIEYIEFNVELSEIGTKVYVDKTFLKATENFAVFPSNGNVIEKGSDYFIIAGSGVADVRIVGKRTGYNRAFWGDIESLPKPEEKSQENNMVQISALQERVKENWFAEQIETRVEKVNGVDRKVIERLDVN